MQPINTWYAVQLALRTFGADIKSLTVTSHVIKGNIQLILPNLPLKISITAFGPRGPSFTIHLFKYAYYSDNTKYW